MLEKLSCLFILTLALSAYSESDSSESADTDAGDHAPPDQTDPPKGCPNLSIDDISQAQTNLLITEVSFNLHRGYTDWIELYNPTSEPINLKNYRLHVGNPYDSASKNMFVLPDRTIESGRYYLIQDSHNKSETQTMNLRHLYKITPANTYYSYKTSSGMVEITDLSNQTVDFVAWGRSKGDNAQPFTASEWLSLPSELSAIYPDNSTFNMSLARTLPYSDENKIDDWQETQFTTKGGHNDSVPKTSSCDWTLDNDDGIPDCAESSDACATYAGLHYHNWGARENQRDIFIEIDYLRGYKGELEMTYVAPKKQMMDAVVRTYEPDPASYTYPIKLHADVGNLLTPDLEVGIFSDHYQLHAYDALVAGGQNLQHKPFVSLSVREHLSSPDKIDYNRIAYGFDYAVKYMDPRREGVFHYVLISYEYFEVSAGGMAYTAAPHPVITNADMSKAGLSNIRESNIIAATISHELGHTLSLKHGGYVDKNYVPNYFSVMNYSYTNRQPRRTEDDVHKDIDEIFCDRDPSFEHLSSPGFYSLFSLGDNSAIDENNINEKANAFTFTTMKQGVDWNCDGKINNSLYSDDINGDKALNTLEDFNDWDAIRKNINQNRSQTGTEYITVLNTQDQTYEQQNLDYCPKIGIETSRTIE